jgi:putative membrane protein
MTSPMLLAAIENDGGAWNEWTWSPGIVIPLVVSAIWYCAGLYRMGQRPQRAGLGWKEPTYFACGWIVLFMALLSPMHELGEHLFWVHMTQHEVLVLICAPLLVLGAPLKISLWVLPSAGRKFVARVVNGQKFANGWRHLTSPLSTWTLHAAALLVWHIPALFDATISNSFVHAAQHISFLGTGLLFWWTVLKPYSNALGYGLRALYLFTTAVYTSLIGAILTFSQHPWYSPYTQTAPAWHLSGLEDQQLGGLVMWVPGGTVLFAATLLMIVQWMRESETRGKLTRTAFLIEKSGGAS